MSKDMEQEGIPLRLRTALRQGDATGVVAALEACCDVSLDTEVLEAMLVEGERSLVQFDPQEARLVADALRGVAVTLIHACENAPQEEAAFLEGSIALVTMAGDRHDVGRYLWHAVLKRHGLTVHDLGRRPPAIAVARGSALNVDAFGLYLDNRLARSHVQTLVSLLQRRRLRTPVLLGGPAVDEASARWVATPGGGRALLGRGLLLRRCSGSSRGPPADHPVHAASGCAYSRDRLGFDNAYWLCDMRRVFACREL